MPVISVNVVFEIVGNISFGSVPRLEVVPAMQLSLGKKKRHGRAGITVSHLEVNTQHDHCFSPKQ